ncbi:MAG: RluA family pseudouridine synthase, partial [Lachnospiraceae bacterium]|nr:RluA family pseudouridine synthase [Lachnospiraceae bacterium]
GIQIIYEDKDILILCKPTNMLSQKAEASELSLNEWLIGYMLSEKIYSEEQLTRFKPSVCNRLDRNTTGLVLAGKTLSGLQFLSELLKFRGVRKYYRLFVKGQIKEERLIEGYLVKDSVANKVKIVKEVTDLEEKSSFILTAYTPVRIMEDKTLLEAELITGKTHQIRAHLSSVGHPLIGDYKYGDRKLNEHYKKAFGIEAQLLHAHRLVFPTLSREYAHLSGREFIAPLPEVFEKLCE